MASKKAPGATTDDHEFEHAESTDPPAAQKPAAAAAPAPEVPKVRNLTQECLEGYFEQKKAEADLMEKPPKDLVNLDPAKRAAQMVGA